MARKSKLALAALAFRLQLMAETRARILRPGNGDGEPTIHSQAPIVHNSLVPLLILPFLLGPIVTARVGAKLSQGPPLQHLDTIIAIVALLEARQTLGLDTSAVEQSLKGIDRAGLILPDGSTSHGYSSQRAQRLGNGWKDFGAETWLANFGCAAATGNLAAMDSTPPTFGFIECIPQRVGLAATTWAIFAERDINPLGPLCNRPGDITPIGSDGAVTVQELIRFITHISGTDPLTGAEACAAGVNCDRIVNVADLIRMILHITGQMPLSIACS